MIPVIVTGAGGPAGRSLIAQLRGDERRSGRAYMLVGADMADVDVEGLTLSVRVPPAESPEFLPALSGLADFVRAELLIPTVSEELPLVAAAAPLIGADVSAVSPLDSTGHADHASPVSARTAVVISDPPAVALAADKLLTMWSLQDAGVAVPAFAPAADARSAAEAVRMLGGPVVRKPRVSRGARGVQVLDDRAPDTAWPRAHDALLQRYAPGAEFCVQVYRSPVTQRTTEAVVLRKTGLTGGGWGNATGVARDDDRPAVAALARDAVAALGITGPADVDVRMDEHDRPVVLEVNARFGAQSAAAPEVLRAVLDEYLAA
jgi:carbamoyl-phosphate synthase large subunit